MARSQKSGWIVTFTGRQFWPLDPRVDDIDIRDIAHGLSNMCRFTGQCREFYSVAEHSYRCASEAPNWLALSMLLHDASEAYLCDVSRPVKHAKGMESYREAEARLMAVIGERYDVSFDDPLVHQIDDSMLMTEKRDLMPPSPTWSVHNPPFPTMIVPYTPRGAELLFLDSFEILTRPTSR